MSIVLATSSYSFCFAQAADTPPPPAPTKPSASCTQPDRSANIASLTPQQRIAQGYPAISNAAIDRFIHDRGVHFCSDTDTPRGVQSSTRRVVNNTEFNDSAWSGNYADGSAAHTYVQSYWTQSCIASGSNDHVSTWVGIGGVNNDNLVQTGSEGDNWNIFNKTYEAWIDNVGANYETNVFNISCGDSMLAEVGAGDCMYVADTTNGSNAGWRCVSPNANTATAECIVERPTVNGVVSYRSNYGTQTFTHCAVEENGGSTVGIGTVTHDYFNMYNGSTLLSSTGPISGGDTYTMTWHNFS